MLNGIRHIIFDLGGVLLNIDPKKTIDAFGKLGMEQLVGDKGLSYDHEIFYQMEQGKITPEEFRNGVRQLLPKEVSDDEIDAAWTAMLLDFPGIRVELVKNLRKDFNIYLFSNTNAIHVEKFHSIFRKQHGFEVSTLFDKDFYSNEIGYRKPSSESFKEIIRLSGINPEESLFIDDSFLNVESAITSGLKGFWLEPGQKVEEIFQEYL
ncbi:haloacid dehalogenase-like hydrolase [Aquipluma nitroreducens]|uniref:Haloacid dehalogenase-like hydrolase n=1 Tax=Aquipluma nitroreducens TaxID=2010828 RepID=A0A5K7S914_9BACT|nr:HAD family phosphatase [Aquipluma nitroreducens]BBE18026.1 haloacid dehalogenase-like hydrolase [Aquipluma nitroreducens]